MMSLKKCFTDVYPWLLTKDDPAGQEPCLRDMIAEYYYGNMSITAQEADEYADRYIRSWIETVEVALFTNTGVNDES